MDSVSPKWQNIILKKKLNIDTLQTTANNCTPPGPSKKILIQSIFTDGSAVSKTNRGGGGNKKDASCKGGYAAAFIDGPIKGTILGSLDISNVFASNIRAEGQAIISSLKKCDQELKEPTQIDIYTDSEFWIKMLQKYMPKWNDSTFEQKANPDMTRTLWELWNAINARHTVSLIHVYSHNKSGLKNSANPQDQFKYVNNELVDRMATEARINLKPGEEIWRH